MSRIAQPARLALWVLWGVIAYCWVDLLPPTSSLLEYLRNPAYFAMLAATLAAAFYSATYIFVADSHAWRRLQLALFLAGMPLVYLWGAIVAGDRTAVLLEAFGMAVFMPMAVFGWRRSIRILGLGIAAHGIAWDAWHHGHAAYMEAWYPVGCLVVDLAFCLVAIAEHYGEPTRVQASMPPRAANLSESG